MRTSTTSNFEHSAMQAVWTATRAAAKSPFVSPCEPGLSCWPPTATGAAKTYGDPLGNSFPTVTDTQAFATCP